MKRYIVYYDETYHYRFAFDAENKEDAEKQCELFVERSKRCPFDRNDAVYVRTKVWSDGDTLD